MEDRKRFRVGRAKIETEGGGNFERYLILKDHVPDYRINEWIDLKSMVKLSTGREYAYKLAVFFNFLNYRSKDIADAEVTDVLAFVIYAVYGTGDSDVFSLKGKISFSTLNKYLVVITGYYRWLDKCFKTRMRFEDQKRHVSKHAFLYGQIWEYDYEDIINSHIRNLKGSRSHIKWYTEEEKTHLCGGFSTLRDKAVFLITLEGFRIDEVLSVCLNGYDGETVTPSRSKGKENDGADIRTIVLPAEGREMLEQYIFTERAYAESESGVISQYMFINLKSGKNQGLPLKYRSFWESMKRCAGRCGMDAKKIRTHSGRSTKVMEYLEEQALHPEKNITDAMIMHQFGWGSLKPLEFYRNFNNKTIARAAYDKLHKEDIHD